MEVTLSQSPVVNRRVAIAVAIVAAVGIAVFCVRAYSLWQDGSTDAPSTSGSRSGSAAGSGSEPARPTSGVLSRENSPELAKSSSKSAATGDPFANSYGSDKKYTVKLVIETDAAANVGYRYRDGKGDGQQVIEKSFSKTRTVRGPLPVAQIGVQALGNSTYVRCSIYVDGIKVISYKAKGAGHVAVCTG